MSNNPNDLTDFTSGHFLKGEPLNAQVDIEVSDTNGNWAAN